MEAARRWRPDCLDLRPGVLEVMVQAAERDNRGDWPWRWMVCGGEVLYPDLQERAERVFGARMLERYGAHEAGQIAWRCLDCGFMHTNDDSVVVEILRDGEPVQPGETGEVVVTGLLSYTMPFLRFRLGDLAEQGPERGGGQCRFGFSRIRAVQGRQIDNLTLADGRSMPTYGLMSTIRQTGCVRRFQILQDSFDRIRILYVPNPGLDRDPGPELERRLLDALPASVGVTTEAVTQISPDGSGKYRYVRSLLSGSPSSSRTPQ
jgi:phenylacetate-CoA ligase